MQRHSLLAAKEGNALPDLTLHRDEGRIVVRWTPDASAESALRFTGEGDMHLAVADVERGLADAVQAVVDRLDGLAETEVEEFRKDWAAIRQATERERRLCESAARLGVDPFDPDGLTDDLEEDLGEVEARLDAPVRDDFLDAAQPRTVRMDMDWLRRAEKLAAVAGRGGSGESISIHGNAQTAHQRGYDCATALRQHLWPANGRHPIGDLDELLVRLGWAQCPSQTLEPGSGSRLEAALTRSDAGGTVAVIGEAGRAARFGIARTIFLRHFTETGGTHQRLATEAHTWEQRASRAFAAEFLAPAKGLSEHLRGRASASQIDELAERYGVSSRAIGRQIENHRLAWINDS